MPFVGMATRCQVALRVVSLCTGTFDYTLINGQNYCSHIRKSEMRY